MINRKNKIISLVPVHRSGKMAYVTALPVASNKRNVLKAVSSSPGNRMPLIAEMEQNN